MPAFEAFLLWVVIAGVFQLISGMIGGLPVTSVVVRTSANLNAGAKTKMSAIFIYTGYKLAKPSIFVDLYKKGFDQFVPFVATVIAIILTDLLIGIAIGIAIGLCFVIRTNFKTSLLITYNSNRYFFRFRKGISFLNKPLLKKKMEEVPANSVVLIDITRAEFIDQDVIGVINDFTHHAPLKNIMIEVKKPETSSSHRKIFLLKQKN